MAQTPANRTAKTTAADVLAQMPAAKQAAYNKLIGDLSSTGEEGVLMLVNMINAPGKGSNANVDYALSGVGNGKRARNESVYYPSTSDVGKRRMHRCTGFLSER